MASAEYVVRRSREFRRPQLGPGLAGGQPELRVARQHEHFASPKQFVGALPCIHRAPLALPERPEQLRI